MFVRVRLTIGAPHRALLVPDQAVGVDRGRAFLWVVNDKDVVEPRQVTLGQSQDGLRVVKEGLKPDEWVVLKVPEGLEPGTMVKRKKETIPDPGSPQRPK